LKAVDMHGMWCGERGILSGLLSLRGGCYGKRQQCESGGQQNANQEFFHKSYLSLQKLDSCSLPETNFRRRSMKS
jgi:hypothetical protein